MVERLTTRFHEILVKEADVSKTQVITKLGQLEDIMEKYGIESVEELDKTFEYVNKLIKAYENGNYKKEKQELIKDRDTWQKACELMAFNYDKKLTCNTCSIKEQCSKQYDGNYEQALCDYFYQRAKDEKENKKCVN